MKFPKITFTMIAVMALLFTACKKDKLNDLDTDPQTNPPTSYEANPVLQDMKASSNGDTVFIDCIGIPFPIRFLTASGDTLTVNSVSQLNNATTQQDSIVDFIYPFQAVGPNGVITINSAQDLGIALTPCITAPLDCDPYITHVKLFYNALNIFSCNNYVYDINYPVTIEVEGQQVVLNKDDDYIPAIGGNPSRYKRTQLVYPITITQFGRDIVLNNDNDVCDFYETLLEPCSNKPAHIQLFFNEGACVPVNCANFIDYPVDITINGTVKTIQTRNDYLSELNASPTAYNDIELVYPVSITKIVDGTSVTFNNDSDICQYLNTCQ